MKKVFLCLIMIFMFSIMSGCTFPVYYTYTDFDEFVHVAKTTSSNQQKKAPFTNGFTVDYENEFVVDSLHRIYGYGNNFNSFGYYQRTKIFIDQVKLYSIYKLKNINVRYIFISGNCINSKLIINNDELEFIESTNNDYPIFIPDDDQNLLNELYYRFGEGYNRQEQYMTNYDLVHEDNILINIKFIYIPNIDIDNINVEFETEVKEYVINNLVIIDHNTD